MKKFLLVTVLCFVMPVLSMAQEDKVTVQQRDNHSISLDVAAHTYGIGYWAKMSDRNDLGINVDLSFRDVDEFKEQSYSLTPALKHYIIPDKFISPYLYLGVSASYGKNDYKAENRFYSGSERISAGVLGGVGVDWFPIQKLSIGGHVGVRASYESTRNSSNTISTTSTFTSAGSSSLSTKEEGFSVNTFNSGIRINLFF